MAWPNIEERRDKVKAMMKANHLDKEIINHCTSEFNCSSSAIYSDLNMLRGTSYHRRELDRIAIRDGYICQYCGVKCEYGVREHVISRSMGGHNEDYNLVYACYSCNVRKRLKVWIPANLEVITINHPEWRDKIISMAT